ncbi:argininosuccinate lyase, chloroplastic [Lolium perenne]|uniref:argininosuccinate lyase, chloroplastic n=1 Tax=Lolium perenne TaxID=4522 RepID=UPI0021F50A66|nr:argininosuccinate lyase, chloroplastic-like [Lolium perenne]
MEALVDIVEGPAKRLDAVISHYDQMLTVLNLWCNDSIDKFVTQIKELQVELVLLAVRNEGLVVPCFNRNAYCILLGDMLLSKVEQLENDVSRLLSCKNKMESTRLTPSPSGSNVCSMSSLCNGCLHHVHNSIMDFGNLIVGDIAHDLTDLENDLHTLNLWLTPNDEVTKSLHLMWGHKIDLGIIEILGHSGSIYNEAADSSKRFLKAYKVVPEMIKAAREFIRNLFFNPEKFPSFPPIGSAGDPKLAGFRASKDLERLYGGEAAVRQDFISHSDDTAGKLLDWLRRLHQLEQRS